jgi:hypothetical protein
MKAKLVSLPFFNEPQLFLLIMTHALNNANAARLSSINGLNDGFG